jgi:uncharacterized spore protein YtfJ
MAQDTEGLFTLPIASHKEGIKLMERLTDVARPSAVYGDPVTVDEHTVITAAEVTVRLGYGYGSGGTEPESSPAEGSEKAGKEEGAPGGYGGGGGGGGGTGARPVAVIHISKDGVSVEPIVDVTKLALAFFTVLGSIFVMGAKIRQAAR